MAYTKMNWVDSPATTSPISADNLNNMETGIFNNDADITNLKNVTKIITATATTNGDFKVNISNALATGLIVYIAFPTATVNTASARLSIDDGTTYKNIYSILASEIESRSVSFRYDGTNWQLDSIINHTNANGNYTKYPDGTMMTMQKTVFTNVAITNANGALFINMPAISLNNFPISFTSIPVVNNTIQTGSLTFMSSTGTPTTTNPGNIFLMRTASTASISGEIHTHAVGKWK